MSNYVQLKGTVASCRKASVYNYDTAERHIYVSRNKTAAITCSVAVKSIKAILRLPFETVIDTSNIKSAGASWVYTAEKQHSWCILMTVSKVHIVPSFISVAVENVQTSTSALAYLSLLTEGWTWTPERSVFMFLSKMSRVTAECAQLCWLLQIHLSWTGFTPGWRKS